MSTAEADDGYESVFNLEAFSDRVLRIEIVGRDDDAPRPGAAAASGCKRRREEDKGAYSTQPPFQLVVDSRSSD